MNLPHKNRPYVLGHRGASGYAPENTMEAFRLAREMKCDGCELDVQMSLDGRLVVIHDEKIDRTSDGRGAVRDMTFEQLRRYNYNRTHPEYEHCDIPLLEEVLQLYRGTGDIVNIELKTGIVEYPGIVEKVLALVEQLDMKQQVIYSSFRHQHCVDVMKLDPQAYVGFLYNDGFLDVIPYVARYGGKALHPSFIRVDGQKYVDQAREYGLDINAWTINRVQDMERACALGITTIITNYPDVAMETVLKYEKNQ